MYTPSSSSQPRPILKRSQVVPAHNRSISADKLVHFPPSPTLTRTFTVHSPTAYDRSPIIVTTNSCALPERGCPGRTYTLGDDHPAPPTRPKNNVPSGGIHLHPRAVSNARDPYARPLHQYHQNNINDGIQRTINRATSSNVPPLIPDISSESDESDGFASPPPEMFYSSFTPAPSIPQPRGRGASNMSSMTHTDSYHSYSDSLATAPTALSFLPHPPSPDDAMKARRRRQRDRSRSRERERDSKYDNRAEDNNQSYKPGSLHRNFAACSVNDSEGCLGGF